MRKFVIVNGIIENVIEADADFALEGKTLVPAEGVEGDIGWAWNDGQPVAPEAPAPSTNPADYRLTKRQICAALIVGGITTDPDAWMLALLDNIGDATTRALAINDWRYAPYYDRSNALFSDADLMTAAGMTSEQIDALWMAAKDLPA